MICEEIFLVFMMRQQMYSQKMEKKKSDVDKNTIYSSLDVANITT